MEIKMRADMADYTFKTLISMKPSAFSLSGASVCQKVGVAVTRPCFFPATVSSCLLGRK